MLTPAGTVRGHARARRGILGRRGPADELDGHGHHDQLSSFAFFVALWVSMVAAMMLPGAAPAVLRRPHANGLRAVPPFVGSYLAVWTLVGVAVYAVS